VEIKELSLDLINSPAVELRTTVDQEYLEALAHSIRELGLLHPIRVREIDGRYEIVSGNCRYLAAKIAGWTAIPCIVTVTAESNLPAITLHENLIRQDVSHMDTARYLAWLKDTKALSVDELAKTFRYSTTWVYQHLKLLECDPEIRDAVDADRLNYQAGLELMRVPKTERRRSLLDSAVRAGASLGVIKGWVASELVEAGLRPASPPVSLGAAMDIIPELSFTCACCTKVQSTERMILIRSCPECYTVIMQALKVLRDQLRKEKLNGAIVGPESK
jgi:ParB family chromosome partitioning protein